MLHYYDPIFAKSFNHYDRKRFAFLAFILCFLLALTICSTFDPHLHRFPLLGKNAVNLQLLINVVEDKLIVEDDHLSAHNNSNKTDVQTWNKTIMLNERRWKQGLRPQSESTKKVVVRTLKPLCRVLKYSNADYCEIEGDVRVDPNSSTVYLVTPHSTSSCSVQPYPRKGIPKLKKWTVKSSQKDNIPKCSQNHSADLPAILFSIGGYTGNHFHDFADVIVPLYSTSFQFNRNVHFLATDYKPWWPWKFQALISKLTKHDLINIDEQHEHVHCYNKVIIGLQYHHELVVNAPSYNVSTYGFKKLLQETYHLDRREATKQTKMRSGHRLGRPRLMIIARKRTRAITNVDEVCHVARKLGYEVVVADGETSSNMTRFAQLVNSCDAMMGVHGAGLTNMVFLPDNAILIQVVPLGAIDGFAKLDFGNPAPGMKVKYLEYKIGLKESSLARKYGVDDPVIRDPMSFHRKGWEEIRAVYLENQNVTIDAPRFRGTLAKALKLLRHP